MEKTRKNSQGKKLTSRAKQAIETKKRILSEGKKLILKRGYEGATIDDICNQAGITVGTFYYYFKGKDELLQGFFPTIEAFKKVYETGENKGAFQKITEFFTFFNTEVEHTVDIDIVRQLFKSDSALAGLNENRVAVGVKYIIEGQLKGEVDESYDPVYIAKLIFAATRGLTFHWAKNPTIIGVGDATRDVVERLTYSFLTPKGKEIADEYLNA